MIRDEPTSMTREDIELLRENIEEVRKEEREGLAADFDNNPGDCRAGD
jgi:hypothetical protein